MYCRICGQYNPNGAQFCSECGTKVESGATNGQPRMPVSSENNAGDSHPVQVTVKVKQRHYGLIILLLLLIVGVGFYVSHYMLQSPQQTLTIFCESMSTMDYRAALNCVDGGSDELYDGALDILDELTGISFGAYGTLLQGLGGLTAAAGLTPTIEVEIDSIDYEDGYTWLDAEHCRVTATLTLIESGRDEVDYEEWTVDMTRSGLKWFIDFDSIADLF